MRIHAAVLLACLCVSSVPSAFADIAAINPKALPQETAVLAAFDDAQQLEPYLRSWSTDWKYPIPKDQVAARISKDLTFLTLAAKSHPDNEELLLLTGLVAHYAYNVDVDGSYDTAMSMLAGAQKLAPSDVRGSWFHANLVCQTTQPKTGAEEFLSIESSHAWDQLPAAFWDDYLECASVTLMPAHALRAADYLKKLHAPPSQMRDFLTETAHHRFDPYDAKKKYGPRDVWSAESSGTDLVFTSTTCGVRLRAHGDWEMNQIGLSNGTCVAYFGTGPYKAVDGSLRPSVLLMVQQPQPDETLKDYASRYTKNGQFSPFAVSRCPADECIALKGVQPGMYRANGDGHGRIVVFERDQPEFPGLIFESPVQAPTPGANQGLQFYRPRQTQQRIPGKLFYLVMLDTAASIEEPAMKDFDFFLQNLVVE